MKKTKKNLKKKNRKIFIKKNKKNLKKRNEKIFMKKTKKNLKKNEKIFMKKTKKIWQTLLRSMNFFELCDEVSSLFLVVC